MTTTLSPYLNFRGEARAALDFYAEAFGWGFTDWGSTYAAFDEGLDGGLQGDAAEAPAAPLVVLWASDLEAAQRKVEAAGGVVTRAVFASPAGGASTSATRRATAWSTWCARERT